MKVTCTNKERHSNGEDYVWNYRGKATWATCPRCRKLINLRKIQPGPKQEIEQALVGDSDVNNPTC